jgi:hypothetical protein
MILPQVVLKPEHLEQSCEEAYHESEIFKEEELKSMLTLVGYERKQSYRSPENTSR